MPPNDTIQPYIDAARREWGRVTPFRLGLLVGKDGADIPCPYVEGSRGAKGYQNGLAWGKSDYAMDQAFNEQHEGLAGE